MLMREWGCSLAFFASLLAYVGFVTGISVGLVMLWCALVAPAGQPSLPQHGRAAIARRSERMATKVPAQFTTGRRKQSILRH